METNTVLLKVEDYNELRDLKKNIKEGKILSVSESWGSFGEFRSSSSVTYYTENEIIETISKENESLKERNSELETKIDELEKTIEKSVFTEPKEITINDLKKMSYWEFRKWRNS